jgi:hypothetical protein
VIASELLLTFQTSSKSGTNSFYAYATLYVIRPAGKAAMLRAEGFYVRKSFEVTILLQKLLQK